MKLSNFTYPFSQEEPETPAKASAKARTPEPEAPAKAPAKVRAPKREPRTQVAGRVPKVAKPLVEEPRRPHSSSSSSEEVKNDASYTIKYRF